MKHYTQLTEAERYQIYALKTAGHSPSEIAGLLARDKSTIYRELKRNTGRRGYRPKQADFLALERCSGKAKTRIDSRLWKKIDRLLREDWSPEKISVWLDNEEQIAISHEWIYQYVYNDKQTGGDLHTHLRCRKKRKKRYGSYSRRGQIPNRVSIDERPAIVETRRRYGDWELDTIIGKGHQQAIVSLTESKSRLTLLAKVINKTAEQVRESIITLLYPIKDWVITMTSDNGKEFAQHEHIAKQLKAKFYFAHPYASWERGLNENT